MSVSQLAKAIFATKSLNVKKVETVFRKAQARIRSENQAQLDSRLEKQLLLPRAGLSPSKTSSKTTGEGSGFLLKVAPKDLGRLTPLLQVNENLTVRRQYQHPYYDSKDNFTDTLANYKRWKVRGQSPAINSKPERGQAQLRVNPFTKQPLP